MRRNEVKKQDLVKVPGHSFLRHYFFTANLGLQQNLEEGTETFH